MEENIMIKYGIVGDGRKKYILLIILLIINNGCY